MNKEEKFVELLEVSREVIKELHKDELGAAQKSMDIREEIIKGLGIDGIEIKECGDNVRTEILRANEEIFSLLKEKMNKVKEQIKTHAGKSKANQYYNYTQNTRKINKKV